MQEQLKTLGPVTPEDFASLPGNLKGPGAQALTRAWAAFGVPEISDPTPIPTADPAKVKTAQRRALLQQIIGEQTIMDPRSLDEGARQGQAQRILNLQGRLRQLGPVTPEDFASLPDSMKGPNVQARLQAWSRYGVPSVSDPTPVTAPVVDQTAQRRALLQQALGEETVSDPRSLDEDSRQEQGRRLQGMFNRLGKLGPITPEDLASMPAFLTDAGAKARIQAWTRYGVSPFSGPSAPTSGEEGTCNVDYSDL
jgi:hypothetical protein